MTKAALILDLYAQGKSPREIAESVDCHPSYVRVVARQRHGTGRSKYDIAYLATPRGAEKNRRSNSKAHDARMAAYHAMPDAERKAIRAEAYAAARREGCDSVTAQSLAANEVMRRAVLRSISAKRKVPA